MINNDIALSLSSVSKARIIGDKDVMVQTGSDINLTCRAEQVIIQ